MANRTIASFAFNFAPDGEATTYSFNLLNLPFQSVNGTNPFGGQLPLPVDVGRGNGSTGDVSVEVIEAGLATYVYPSATLDGQGNLTLTFEDAPPSPGAYASFGVNGMFYF